MSQYVDLEAKVAKSYGREEEEDDNMEEEEEEDSSSSLDESDDRHHDYDVDQSKTAKRAEKKSKNKKKTRAHSPARSVRSVRVRSPSPAASKTGKKKKSLSPPSRRKKSSPSPPRSKSPDGAPAKDKPVPPKKLRDFLDDAARMHSQQFSVAEDSGYSLRSGAVTDTNFNAVMPPPGTLNGIPVFGQWTKFEPTVWKGFDSSKSVLVTMGNINSTNTDCRQGIAYDGVKVEKFLRWPREANARPWQKLYMSIESADQVQKMIAMAVEAYRKEKKEFEKNLDKLNSDLSEEGKKLIRIKRK